MHCTYMGEPPPPPLLPPALQSTYDLDTLMICTQVGVGVGTILVWT